MFIQNTCRSIARKTQKQVDQISTRFPVTLMSMAPGSMIMFVVGVCAYSVWRQPGLLLAFLTMLTTLGFGVAIGYWKFWQQPGAPTILIPFRLAPGYAGKRNERL